MKWQDDKDLDEERKRIADMEDGIQLGRGEF